MSTVNLDEKEWQQVMGALSQQPWHLANPLLMKIGEQLQRQVTGPVTNSGNEIRAEKRNEASKAARS